MKSLDTPHVDSFRRDLKLGDLVACALNSTSPALYEVVGATEKRISIRRISAGKRGEVSPLTGQIFLKGAETTVPHRLVLVKPVDDRDIEIDIKNLL